MGTINGDSTPHASPGNGVANQAGSFSSFKPSLTCSDQLNLMVSRGLRVNDRNEALQRLSELNYYRLRGYWLAFEKDDAFIEGTTFEDITDVYDLDSKFRRWVWAALEPIEIKARTTLAQHLSMAYGPLAHLNSGLFNNASMHAESINNVRREIEQARKNKVPCVLHNLKKYGELPIWAAVEIMSLGTVSKLYGNLSNTAVNKDGTAVMKAIAEEFGLKPHTLRSWLRHLTYVRNICGHHSRLYNRVMTNRPTLLKADKPYASNKQFPTLLVLMRIYQNSWPEKWNEMVNELDCIMSGHDAALRSMGFPDNWKQVLASSHSNRSGKPNAQRSHAHP